MPYAWMFLPVRCCSLILASMTDSSLLLARSLSLSLALSHTPKKGLVGQSNGNTFFKEKISNKYLK